MNTLYVPISMIMILSHVFVVFNLMLMISKKIAIGHSIVSIFIKHMFSHDVHVESFHVVDIMQGFRFVVCFFVSDITSFYFVRAN